MLTALGGEGYLGQYGSTVYFSSSSSSSKYGNTVYFISIRTYIYVYRAVKLHRKCVNLVLV